MALVTAPGRPVLRLLIATTTEPRAGDVQSREQELAVASQLPGAPRERGGDTVADLLNDAWAQARRWSLPLDQALAAEEAAAAAADAAADAEESSAAPPPALPRWDEKWAQWDLGGGGSAWEVEAVEIDGEAYKLERPLPLSFLEQIDGAWA